MSSVADWTSADSPVWYLPNPERWELRGIGVSFDGKRQACVLVAVSGRNTRRLAWKRRHDEMKRRQRDDRLYGSVMRNAPVELRAVR